MVVQVSDDATCCRLALSRRFAAAVVVLFCLAGSQTHAAGATNVPVSVNPPGGLAPAQTPQIVLLTFDDSVTTGAYDVVQQVLTNHWNPNGDAIKATFFVSLDASVDYSLIQRLYAAGHEIAAHSMTETTGSNTSLTTWRAEIVGCRKTISRLAAVPESDIVGFRAPYLAYNNDSFRILAERGFAYDASIIEAPGTNSLSTDGRHYIWPYTLDSGVHQACVTGLQPTQSFAGLFEVPLWDNLSNGVPVFAQDPPVSYASNAVLTAWKTNFLMHYNGNRAPYTLSLHAALTNQWLADPGQPWRIPVLNGFISWAQSFSNVWLVSTRDLTRFMQNPCNTVAAYTSAPFHTVTSAVFPAEEISVGVYESNSTLNVCGTAPPFYPSVSNIYSELVPMAGGALTLNILTNEADSTEIHFLVTNNLAVNAADWAAVLQIPTNYPILYQIDGVYNLVTNGNMVTITVQPAMYVRPLHSGELQDNAYLIIGATEVPFMLTSFTLYDIGAMRPEITGLLITTNQRVSLNWTDSAFGYRVEANTNLLGTNWTVRAEVYGSTAWSGSRSNFPSTFFRLKGIP